MKIEFITPAQNKTPVLIIPTFEGQKLSEDFAHVRVDLYLLADGTIKFGELTFTSSSGVARWSPKEADLIVGQMFNLPKKSSKKK